ncbi:cytochrome d ubiquinol oxidase subunit II, partial [Cribrihabitans sp. XS_ASV171]
MFDLAFLWAGLIAFAVLVYVILDGFDLGVGILFPLARDTQERDMMMKSVEPVWDGNETWLIMGGGGLLAAFPLAYAVALPALYVPLVLMLLALVFRGVAFEYRWRTEKWRRVWDTAFIGGSATAAVCQGISLGALVQGIAVEGRAYAGGWWDWLTPFSLLTGLALAVGYALLGATWLVMKIEGDLQTRMRRYAYGLTFATLVLIALVSLLVPFQQQTYFDRWFTAPGVFFTPVIPLMLLGASIVLLRALQNDRDHAPFLASLALFVLSFIGFGTSIYPYVVPPSLTINAAAAPER